MRNGYILGAVAVVFIVVIGGLLIHSRANAPTTPAKDLAGLGVASTTEATTTVDIGNGQKITLPPGAVLKEIDSTTTISMPSLSTNTIKISSSLSPDVQKVLRAQEEQHLAELKANPNRLDLWLKLGIDRKIAGDYKGAEEVWIYVGAFKSNVQYIAYGDLGDLYMNFLKNYPKAEANYKAAIALQPTFIDYYRDLFTLYTSFYKTNTSAAADIVAQGLKANPGNPDLLQLQKQLKAR